MRCRECRALLWSYIDCELPVARQRAVETHLDACLSCRLAHERFLAFPLQVGNVSAIPPPPDFTTRLMRRIEVLPPPSELRLADHTQRGGAFGSAVGAVLAFSVAAAAVLLGLISTSLLALLNGRAVPISFSTSGGPLQSLVSGIGGWLATQLLLILSWPVLLALLGMQIALAALWFRVVTTRRRSW